MTLRCPVCRATQTLRETCRRCQADLRLLSLANRRTEYVQRELEQARTNRDAQRERALATELRWLSPRNKHSTE